MEDWQQHWNKGGNLFQRGHYQAAIPELESANSLNPSNLQVKRLLGEAKGIVKRQTDHLNNLRRDVELNPSEKNPRLNLINGLRGYGGKYSEALMQFRELVCLGIDGDDVFTLFTEMLTSNKRDVEAEWRGLMEQCPYCLQRHLRFLTYLQSKKKIDEVRQEYIHLSHKYPQNIEIRHEYIKFLLALDALKELDSILIHATRWAEQETSDNASTVRHKTQYLKTRAEYQELIPQYEAVLYLNQDADHVLLGLAICYEVVGRRQQAVSLFEKYKNCTLNSLQQKAFMKFLEYRAEFEAEVLKREGQLGYNHGSHPRETTRSEAWAKVKNTDLKDRDEALQSFQDEFGR